MAEIEKYIRLTKNNGDVILTNLIDSDTGEAVEYIKVQNPVGIVPDGKIYKQLDTLEHGVEIFRLILDSFGGKPLVKDTMADMKAASFTEIILLNLGYYKCVQLNGYYVKGDTPAPINYYWNPTSTTIDDGGSVIQIINQVNGRLEHFFQDAVDVRYFGLRSGTQYVNNPNLVNNIFINNQGKTILFDYGTDFTMSMGTYWDNGTVIVPSNTDIVVNGTIRHTESRNGNASMFLVMNVENVNISGSGTLVGYKHKRPPIGVTGQYYQSYYRDVNYSVGQYLDYNSYGYQVVQSGVGTTLPNPTSATPVGTVYQVGGAGGLHLSLIEKGLGEWGYGIYIFSGTNVSINGLTLKEFWGDGSAAGGTDDTIETLAPSINIKYTNCIFDDNRRQGVSIGNGDGITFENCSFTNTYGTLPMAGVDLEPNPTNSDGSLKVGYVRNVLFENCKLNNNYTGLLCFNPFGEIPDRIDNVTLNNCELSQNQTVNLSITRAQNIEITESIIETTTRGDFAGEISVSAINFKVKSCKIVYYKTEANNNNNAIINLRNIFVDLTLPKTFIIENTVFETPNLSKPFITYQQNCTNLDLDISKCNINVKNSGLLNTAGAVTNIGSVSIQYSNITAGSGFITNATTTVGQKFKIYNNNFKVHGNILAATTPYFNASGLILEFYIDGNIFENNDTEVKEFQILRLNNFGTGRSLVYNNTFIGFTRISSELIQTVGSGSSTPSHIIDNNTFVNCNVVNLFSTNRTVNQNLYIRNNKNNTATTGDILRVDGGVGIPAGGWRVLFNLNSFVSLGNFFEVGYQTLTNTNCENNLLNHTFRALNQIEYKQAESLPPTATTEEIITALKDAGLMAP